MATGFSVLAQRSGQLKGVVRPSAGGPAAGVVVVVTNQVTRVVRRDRTEADGSYSISLPAGAYRLNLDQPNTAQFDKDKNYGDFAIVRGDTLENVIIEAGKDTVVEIPIAPSQTAPDSQRRDTPDRWRLQFPEYDRYGDRGARGRDIPFKRVVGGILTIKTSSKATILSKATSCF